MPTEGQDPSTAEQEAVDFPGGEIGGGADYVLHRARIDELESEMGDLSARRGELAEALQQFESADHLSVYAVNSAKRNLGSSVSNIDELSGLLSQKHQLVSAMSDDDLRRHDELVEVNGQVESLRFRVNSGRGHVKHHLELLANPQKSAGSARAGSVVDEALGAQHEVTRRRIKRGIPIAFAIAGAIVGILLGIPSYTVDRGTRSKPPFFDVYCTEVSYLAGACRVSPGGILLMAFLSALILGAVGFGIALLLKSRKPYTP